MNFFRKNWIPLVAAALCLSVCPSATRAQSPPPLTITETDGAPRKTNATKLVFPPGTVSVSGGTVTIDLGALGGGTVTNASNLTTDVPVVGSDNLDEVKPFAATAGSVYFAGVAGVMSQDNANLFWDSGNHRLGIGTNTPIDTVSIGTEINASASHALFNLSNTALVSGSANGTYIGANPAVFTGDFFRFQVAGADKAILTSGGSLSINVLQLPYANFPQTAGIQFGVGNTNQGITSQHGTNDVIRLMLGGADALFIQRVIATGKTDLFIEGDNALSTPQAGIIFSTLAGVNQARVFTDPAVGSGNLFLTNTAAGTTFISLTFGTGLSSNPQIRVDGAGFAFRLGDNSADAAIKASTATLSGLTSGSVVFAGTGGLLSQDNAHLFYGNPNGNTFSGLFVGSRSTSLGSFAANNFSVTNDVGGLGLGIDYAMDGANFTDVGEAVQIQASATSNVADAITTTRALIALAQQTGSGHMTLLLGADIAASGVSVSNLTGAQFDTVGTGTTSVSADIYSSSTSTNAYGIRVNNVVGGATGNWAIKTGTGLVQFGDNVTASGNLTLSAAGNGLKIKEGSNATMGTGTCNGATEVTVSTTKVTATSRIFYSFQAVGGTPLGIVYTSARSAGTSFGFKCAATDTSTVAWLIMEPAP